MSDWRRERRVVSLPLPTEYAVSCSPSLFATMANKPALFYRLIHQAFRVAGWILVGPPQRAWKK
jgi:hypothetical protein